jgi:Cu(I)/Ag(I) efflux system membrane protein CusA/SilA
MLALWDVNLSIAVWVGFLVLFGVMDDDGVVMSTYLEQIFDHATFHSV